MVSTPTQYQSRTATRAAEKRGQFPCTDFASSGTGANSVTVAIHHGIIVVSAAETAYQLSPTHTGQRGFHSKVSTQRTQVNMEGK